MEEEEEDVRRRTSRVGEGTRRCPLLWGSE